MRLWTQIHLIKALNDVVPSYKIYRLGIYFNLEESCYCQLTHIMCKALNDCPFIYPLYMIEYK